MWPGLNSAPLDIVLESPQDYVQESSEFDDDFEDDFGFDETSSNGYWWNIINIKPQDPVLLGICKQVELETEVLKAAKAKANKKPPKASTVDARTIE